MPKRMSDLMIEARTVAKKLELPEAGHSSLLRWHTGQEPTLEGYTVSERRQQLEEAIKAGRDELKQRKRWI